MKVYVVTVGSYSDYRIDRIFTDRKKAENYKEWTYDANEIEEYDTEDNFVFEKFYKTPQFNKMASCQSCKSCAATYTCH